MTDITFSILLFRTKLLGQIHGQISHRPTLSGEICKHSFISTVIPCTVHMVNIYRVSVPSKSFIFKFLRCSVEGASWKTMGPFTIVLLSSLSRTQDFLVREIEKTCKENTKPAECFEIQNVWCSQGCLANEGGWGMEGMLKFQIDPWLQSDWLLSFTQHISLSIMIGQLSSIHKAALFGKRIGNREESRILHGGNGIKETRIHFHGILHFNRQGNYSMTYSNSIQQQVYKHLYR